MQASLDAHEQRMKEVQTKSKWKLHAQSNKDQKGKVKWTGNRGRGVHRNSHERNYQESNSSNQKHGGYQTNLSGNYRGGGNIQVEEERRNLTETVTNVTIVKSIATFHMSAMQINKKDTSEDVVKLAR